ncbi:MAG: transporter substrate-binding domain-containing protein [Chloroflexi bacterium]|nr:transporter substrate-binding domain-containing protein [Chloroflexota bacterium]
MRKNNLPGLSREAEHQALPRSTRLSWHFRTILLALVLMVATGVAIAQDVAIPTLVPPTVVPNQPVVVSSVVPTESGIAHILRDGKVRVGILYNEPPFGEYSIRGEEYGFDADLARAMAEAWGVSVEFLQVTRQTRIDMVETGAVDLLMAAQPHNRALDSRVEFSQAYYPSVQSLLVREGDGATVLDHMADRQIGVIIGTRGEGAVEEWRARVPYTFNVQRFLTLDEALAALDTQQIDGVVESRTRLTRRLAPGKQRFVDVPVTPEPFAVAMRRQDVHLRQLVDRTLQYLFLNGKLDEIHQKHFNGEGYPGDSFRIWDNVGTEAPRPDQFGQDIPAPVQSTLANLQSTQSLRVAGLRSLPSDAPESERRVDNVNRALINALAARWQVNVVPVPDNGQNPLDVVAAGGADIAVGVEPDWARALQVDFTGHYLVHGFRLMVRTADNIGGFGDLRGKIIGVLQTDSSARDLVGVFAQREAAVIDDFFTILREQDAAFTLLAENNAHVVFGDSLKLIPHVQADPEHLALTTNAAGRPLWYTRDFLGLAVARNDLDFRLLVEYTLQDLWQEGALPDLLSPVMLPGETPLIEIWPGRGTVQGALLAG